MPINGLRLNSHTISPVKPSPGPQMSLPILCVPILLHLGLFGHLIGVIELK